MDKEIYKGIIQEQKIRLGHLQIDTVDKQIQDILYQVSKAEKLTITLPYYVLKDTLFELYDLGFVLKETGIKSGEHTRYDFTFL